MPHDDRTRGMEVSAPECCSCPGASRQPRLSILRLASSRKELRFPHRSPTRKLALVHANRWGLFPRSSPIDRINPNGLQFANAFGTTRMLPQSWDRDSRLCLWFANPPCPASQPHDVSHRQPRLRLMAYDPPTGGLDSRSAATQFSD
jgi:hypothetical protein